MRSAPWLCLLLAACVPAGETSDQMDATSDDDAGRVIKDASAMDAAMTAPDAGADDAATEDANVEMQDAAVAEDATISMPDAGESRDAGPPPELTCDGSIMRNASGAEIKQAALAQGLRTLRDDGAHKVLSGLSTIDEVMRVTAEEA